MKCLLGLLVVLGLLSGSVLGEELPYQEPKFGVKLLAGRDVEALGSVPKEELQKLLLELSGHAEIDGETRGKAMYLAFALGAEKEVIEMNHSLRFGSPEFYPNDGSLDSLADRMGVFVKNLSKSSVTNYLSDLAASISGAEPFEGSLYWTHVLPEEARSAGAGIASISAAGAMRRPNTIYFEEANAGAGNMGAGDLGAFKKRQSLIKGLLVIQLEGSNFAGGASQMNATVVPGQLGGTTKVEFNQEVGELMETGLGRVLQFVKTGYDFPEEGYRVEISFESQYSPKDGDSASVACALLLDSLLTGDEIDTGFAVTGAMSPEGEVKAVGGIDGKIRGAASRGCTHVAIPKVNANALYDMLILDGFKPLSAIQVFTIDTFESAKQLATPTDKRKAELTEAIELFGTVQTVLSRPSNPSVLKNAQVQARLKKVVQLAPNHASARLIYLAAIGRAPKELTLLGSITAIDRAALPLIQGLQNTEFEKSSSLNSDEFADAASNLKRLRPQLDKRAWATADAIIEFSELFRILRNNPPNSRAALQDLGRKIRASSLRVERSYENLGRIFESENK